MSGLSPNIPQWRNLMIFGMSIHAFTILHVILSLAGIAAGLVAIFALAANKLSGLTGFFLATTALTNITGFLFPFHGVTPAIILGVLSTIVLLLAAIALYGSKLAGRLARNVCHQRFARALLQCLRALRPAFCQGAGSQSRRSHTIVASFWGNAARRPGCVHCAGNSGAQGFSRLSAGLGAEIRSYRGSRR